MNVALPEWQGRVSPVLDVAERLLVVTLGDGGREQQRRYELLSSLSVEQRVERLVWLEVDAVICCGISQQLETALVGRGINLIAEVCGEVDDVLTAYCEGRLDSDRFAMPGRCGRGRRHRHGQSRQPDHQAHGGRT